MKTLKIFLPVITLTIIFFNVHLLHSQMKIGAGTFSCNFNGDTLSFGLNTDLNDLYFMAMGGTADFGLIKIQWDGKTPANVKVMTLQLEKGFVESESEKISVIWADFYTNTPYIIKSGTLTVTGNDGSRITGTLELSVELGGNSILNEFLKGKKETVLRSGSFEINY